VLCLGKTALSNQGGHVRIVSGVFQYGLVVQLVRVPACHAGRCGFESRPDRQILPLDVNGSMSVSKTDRRSSNL
jgi:hypothetical protein